MTEQTMNPKDTTTETTPDTTSNTAVDTPAESTPDAPTPTPPEAPAVQPRKPYFLLRALVGFVVCMVMLLGVYRLGYHYYGNVATWAGEESPRDAMVYEDTTYYLAGKVGTQGMSSNNYKPDELLGEVKPASLFDQTPPLLVWSVEKKEGYLILIDEEGHKYLYYAEKMENPAQ